MSIKSIPFEEVTLRKWTKPSHVKAMADMIFIGATEITYRPDPWANQYAKYTVIFRSQAHPEVVNFWDIDELAPNNLIIQLEERGHYDRPHYMAWPVLV